jgi:predicted ATPase
MLMEGQDVGTIRIDETTRRLLPARFVTGGSPSIPQLLAEASALASEQPRQAGTRPSPFLGRDRDVASLLSVLEETRDEKVARSVLLLGPPGLGKSRLLREFLTAIEGTPPYLATATGTLLRVERRYPALAPVLAVAGIDVQGKSSQHVEAALVAWMESRCTPAGFMLVIEDLQWADGPSLELLDRVLHRLHDRPLLVIGVGRDEVEDRFPGLWSARSVRRLRLRPLAPKQGLTLLRFWIPSVSRTGADFVLERWEGNPQFLEEMVANVERGTLGVPDVVHAIVEGRLEGVEPDVRRVLRAASLFGEISFSVDALIALLGEAARKGIAEWLEVLVMRDFVEREVKAGEASYRVRERLVRDAAYQMLTSADRVLGRRLARAWLEGAGRTLPEFLTDPTMHTSRRSAAGG